MVGKSVDWYAAHMFFQGGSSTKQLKRLGRSRKSTDAQASSVTMTFFHRPPSAGGWCPSARPGDDALSTTSTVDWLQWNFVSQPTPF